MEYIHPPHYQVFLHHIPPLIDDGNLYHGTTAPLLMQLHSSYSPIRLRSTIPPVPSRLLPSASLQLTPPRPITCNPTFGKQRLSVAHLSPDSEWTPSLPTKMPPNSPHAHAAITEVRAAHIPQCLPLQIFSPHSLDMIETIDYRTLTRSNQVRKGHLYT